MTFKVDDGQDAIFDIASNPARKIIWHNLLFSSGTMSPGTHTVQITQNVHLNSSGDGTLFLDYFTYTPSDKTDRNGLRLLVDDHDPRIRYGQNWVPQDSNTDFFRHTTTQSTVAGSSFEFEFEGEVLPLMSCSRPNVLLKALALRYTDA